VGFDVSILARFPGRCGLCDEPIHVDDEIEELDGEWCHAACVEDEEDDER